ncbi:hypothetical protein [Streptomyces sp. Ac-502]|uniref:hypothetical protein n=1 Tax=Streptomyces sp. Ac-502 TaxID=3342801 RepID=UPI0038628E65
MRLSWDDLPAAVRDAVAGRVGPVAAARDVGAGFNCQLATALESGAGGGTVFAKGLCAPGGPELAGQDTEQALAPVVRTVGPRLRHRVRTGGWDVLLFDHIQGRHARLEPGSADLPAVAALLTAAAVLDAPAGLPPYAERWARHGSAAELALLGGDALVHADVNPHNLLVSGGSGGGRGWWTGRCPPAAPPGPMSRRQRCG